MTACLAFQYVTQKKIKTKDKSKKNMNSCFNVIVCQQPCQLNARAQLPTTAIRNWVGFGYSFLTIPVNTAYRENYVDKSIECRQTSKCVQSMKDEMLVCQENLGIPGISPIIIISL